MKYANATDYTRSLDRFQYFAEDVECPACLYYLRKSKFRRNGCGREVCAFDDIRRDAIANGRIARKRGYFSCRA